MPLALKFEMIQFGPECRVHELQRDRALDEVDEDRVQVEQQEGATVGVVGVEAVAARGYGAGLGPLGRLTEQAAHVGGGGGVERTRQHSHPVLGQVGQRLVDRRPGLRLRPHLAPPEGGPEPPATTLPPRVGPVQAWRQRRGLALGLARRAVSSSGRARDF